MKRFLICLSGAALLACSAEDLLTESEEPTETELYGSAVTKVDHGSVLVSDEGTSEVKVNIPAGSESFAVMLGDLGTDLAIANKVTSPSGQVIFDFEDPTSLNRTDANDVHYTFLAPTHPSVEIEAGEWIVNLMSGKDTILADTEVVIKKEPASAMAFDINLFFVGMLGLTADSAQTDESFQKIVNDTVDVYEMAGFTIENIAYHDVDEDVSAELGVIESIDGPDSELAQLFELSGTVSNRAMNYFFVEDIGGGDAGFTLVGLAGSVPGPPGVHGTPRSGIAVNLANYIEAVNSGDATMLEDAQGQATTIMAHEGGHYLGLFHTVERNGVTLGGDNAINGEDKLEDTETCPDSADMDGGGSLSPEECEGMGADNLMFWSPENSSTNLTPQQIAVITANPVVR